MLTKLSINNYALIDKLDIGFDRSLNIITGETGAGKSILLGALGLLTGNKADLTVLKDKQRNCTVEGVFDIGSYGLEQFFVDNDLEYEEQTVISRVISHSGKSRAYVNDLPVQLTVLRELSAKIIDVHSQHQTLMLADENYRIGLVDAVSGTGEIRTEYESLYRQVKQLEKSIMQVREDVSRNASDGEWIRFQLTELDSGILDHDHALLEERFAELANADAISGFFAGMLNSLDKEEDGLLPVLKSLISRCRTIEGVYPKGAILAERLNSIMIELKDIGYEASSESDRIHADPHEMERIGNIVDELNRLHHKHHTDSVTDLIDLRDRFREQVRNVDNGSELLEKLEQEMADTLARAMDVSGRLTRKREQGAEIISSHVEDLLDKLGMPGSSFIVKISKSETLRASGNDTIAFMFSASSKSGPLPVEKAASGGELSRIMLALKNLYARSADLPTIIFDEIDTGVSGSIADSMGNIIADMAGNMQIINITHLPQVASKGSSHYRVYKTMGEDAAVTCIEKLGYDDRVNEIAKMLSGSTVTGAATEQARTLLGNAKSQ